MTKEEILRLRCHTYKDMIKRYIPDWEVKSTADYYNGYITTNDYRFLHDLDDVENAESTEPIPLEPRHVWLANRLNEVCCAIQKHVVEKHEIPREWMKEMCWLTDQIYIGDDYEHEL